MSTPPGPQDPYGQQPQQPNYGQQPPQYGQQPGYGGPQPPSGYYGGPPQGEPPGNHLVWAIISLLLCWPLGIPAIVFATQVNTKWSQGDVAGAHEAAGKAKTFALWATIIGAIFIVLYIGLVVVGGVLSVGSGFSTFDY